MGVKTLENLEREFGASWTENLSINTDSTNPHFDEVSSMVHNRRLSLSLRKSLRMN